MADKFPSQQAALRQALTMVLGVTPVKGSLVISDEQRAKVGEIMMDWLKQDLWSIKPGTRAAAEPLRYITGKNPTDLIQAWVVVKQRSDANANTGSAKPDPMALIKQALDAGLITQEQAQSAAMKLLGIG